MSEKAASDTAVFISRRLPKRRTCVSRVPSAADLAWGSPSRLGSPVEKDQVSVRGPAGNASRPSSLGQENLRRRVARQPREHPLRAPSQPLLNSDPRLPVLLTSSLTNRPPTGLRTP